MTTQMLKNGLKILFEVRIASVHQNDELMNDRRVIQSSK